MSETGKAREQVVQAVIELRGLPRRSPAQAALVARINEGLDALIEAARKEGRGA